jgi:hypothetical protein
MPQRPTKLHQVGSAIGRSNGHRIKHTVDQLLERVAGIENALEIVNSLQGSRCYGIVHQHLGVAHDGIRRRAQFLPNIGDNRPLRSPRSPLVNQINRDTTLPSRD